MRARSRLVVSTVLAFTAAACAGLADSSPVGVTSFVPVPGIDTTPGAPAKVKVSGHVRGVAAVVPSPGSNDTLRFEAIGRAKVRVVRNVLVNGQASQVTAAELVSAADGSFAVRDLPGGYYVIYVDPPAGSAYVGNYSYLAAMQPEVTVDVYLWKR